MEDIQVMDTEVMPNIVGSEGSSVGSAVIIGGAMVAGAVLWNKVAKPVGRWLRTKLNEAKNKHAEKAKPVESVEADAE